jgi:hypothetical protein
MANEITINMKGLVVNGYLRSEFNPGPLQFTQTTVGGHFPIVSVGNGAEEDFDTGDVGIANAGILMMRNLDTANYVIYGPKSGGVMVPFGRIKAGELASFRFEPSITMRWQANTAAVKVQVWLLQT